MIDKSVMVIFKRDLFGYFETPVAYVFIVVFLLGYIALKIYDNNNPKF